MCLATVYKAQEPETKLFEFVSRIDVDGETITLTDVMGEQKVVEGAIRMVDLANSIVKIDCIE
ncbi:MAG: CooT family nickel-binding protein [Firmicutes bacterium]|nr:CooT family nickel-binding protein [Lachnospiraceae bacterium]MDD6066236.1 CooT family nickel-binding protein [Bacillota bacterium]MDY2820139.1 CooT family nickel-binding protein [Hominisplanchenecus sp.]